MLDIIIGHITQTSAKIWIKGSEQTQYGYLTYSNADNSYSTGAVYLGAETNYINVIEIANLTPNTRYEISLLLAKDETTDKKILSSNSPTSFRTDELAGVTSFLLGSCNLQSFEYFLRGDKYFAGINQLVDDKSIDFMMHAGDQIYADIPFLWRYFLPFFSIKAKHYYKSYIKAWNKPNTAYLLSRIPHYMMLDDHEIINGFSNDKKRFNRKLPKMKDAALQAYDIYVHNRQPQEYGKDARYYSFSKNGNEFFVLDTRSCRMREKKQMIDDTQMGIFLHWLKSCPAESTKFVVSASSFIGDVKKQHESREKWCGKYYKSQKEQIIDYIAHYNIRKIVFLTGDMHNSFHAEMFINDKISVHEIMSSPINQIEFSKPEYYNNFGRETTHVTRNGTKYNGEIVRASFFNKRAITHIEHIGNNLDFTIYELKKDGYKQRYKDKIII